MSSDLQKTLPWLWYPLVICAAVALHISLSVAGVSLVYSTYIPVLLAAASVTLLEMYFPYRDCWKPKISEVKNDSSYMVVVQVLLPQFLSYLIAISLIASGDDQSSIWPSHYPVLVQVILMILLADFLRYWLHRAFHEIEPLWQFHAVHHSPDKLYWLNVGRFHPVEKSVQFLFDALPFIVLGVDQTVLSLYFVFYAVNGYFQHSNIDVRFGWLNYLISSAELHRWHHSDLPEESNRNYGNNVIIWDVLFGTYYAPKARVVDSLGLQNKEYPSSFSEQMKTPFIPGLEKRRLPFVSCKEIITNCCLNVRWRLLYLIPWSRFMRSTKSPMQTQRKLLLSILASNKNSRFGVDHDFASITSAEAYARQCPIQNYDTLKPYMEDDSGQGLTAETPSFYQVTSGTTGAAKYLPMTKTGLNNDKTLQNMVALSRYLDNPCTYTGKMFAIVSPAIEGHMDSGVPFGSASGLTYMNMPYMARSKYVVPYPIFEITDYDKKYLLIALYALAESQVSIAATANPSTLVRLLEIINQNAEQLLRVLSTGDSELPGIDSVLMNNVWKSLKPDTARAKSLRDLLSQNGRLSYADIWPNLQQLVTWTGGSCGIALSSLRRDLPDSTKIVEMGYLASEVRGSLTLGNDTGLPSFANTFFEFVERDEWEADRENILLLDQLEVGNQYYVIVTTVNGLYRYFMNDIIEVTGHVNQCPTIRFLQKGKGATNITGEKLYESQVLAAIQALEGETNTTVRFQQWVAEEESSQYLVYLESNDAQLSCIDSYADVLERALCGLNMEYEHKRASGRLKPVQVRLLSKGTGERYKRFNLASGQREGQYKTLALIYRKDCEFPFDEYTRKGDKQG